VEGKEFDEIKDRDRDVYYLELRIAIETKVFHDPKHCLVEDVLHHHHDQRQRDLADTNLVWFKQILDQISIANVRKVDSSDSIGTQISLKDTCALSNAIHFSQEDGLLVSIATLVKVHVCFFICNEF
jgi:hypothetical protein